MNLRNRKTTVQAIGWWGCLSCGGTVNNTHTGPCVRCGGRIGRIVPEELERDFGFRILLPAAPLLEPIPQVAPKHAGNLLALVAAAVLCIGSPLLGASQAGWNAASLVMALNIWSSSVGYYALARVRANANPNEGAPIHA
jgi:hypothetical protein